ncbi:MAG: lysylphosphatidylglycerol synthase transmembrane domain-containing protein [bacterium]|nr:lysylphosphatidylglycerol synthase transmembrane domain-containing protein [bacterium]
MLKKKNFLRIVVNSILGIVLVFVWTRFVNLGQTFAILKTVQLQWVAFFFLFYIISTLLRGLRFKILLGDYKLPLKDLSLLNVLSQFLSFMIPIRLGEITKSVYLTSQFDLPLGKALTWVFVDRFLDFWVVLLLIVIFLFLTPTILPASLAQSVLVVFLVFSLAAVIIVSSQSRAKKLVTFLGKFLIFEGVKEKVVSFIHTIIEGFEVLRRHPLEVVWLVVLTILATVSDSMIWIIAFKSLGIDLGIGKVILGNSLTALTFIVPAAPGYVGSAEASILAVFGGILGLEANMVSAASVLYHVVTIITLLIGGLSALYLLKFDLGLVWKKVKGG